MNDFQYRLLKAISAKGISAADLSRSTGIDKGALSNYINGVYVAKQDKAFKLAAALDVDPGWLMTGDEPPAKLTLSTTERQIVMSYRTKDEGTKFAVRKLLDVEEM